MCMTIKDKYIDPFTDFGFKHIFGKEENKHLLISFLNDLLDIEAKIVDIEYRNLEKLGLNVIDRKAIFDIYCTDEKNSNFIVELQRSKQKYFKDRALYYTTFPIQEQSHRGDWDYELKKVYFVGILDFVMDETKPHYLTKVELMDTQTKDTFYDKLTYYYLEMPKFQKEQEELSTHLEYWLYYLNNLADIIEIPQKLKEDKILTDAFKVAEFLALNKEAQWSYQQDLKRRLDYKAVLDYAIEEATKEGMERGIEKGIDIGIEKGIDIGMEKGKIDSAIAMIKEFHLPIEQVASKLNIAIDELERYLD